MDLKTFYKLSRKKSIEEKLELIYQSALTMSCDAFNAGEARANHNREDYEYDENERYAMKARIRYLCWQIMEDLISERRKTNDILDTVSKDEL